MLMRQEHDWQHWPTMVIAVDQITPTCRDSSPVRPISIWGNRTFRADWCALVLKPFVGQALAQGHISERTPVSNLLI